MADKDQTIGSLNIIQRWKEFVSGYHARLFGAMLYTPNGDSMADDTADALKAKLSANSGVDIGDVDVTSVVPGTGATNLGKAVDSVAGATDTGIVPLAIRDDALAALTPIEGDYVPLRTDANGALWTRDDALDAVVAGSELQVDVVAALPAGDNNIGNVDIVTLPAGNLGQQAMAASLSTVPASNITDATYIGDIKFGEALPAGTALLGKVGIDQTTPGTTNKVATDPVTATPTAYNVTCTVADTEYSQALAANCRGFEFQARTEAILRFAFATGKVAGPTAPYLTLKAGDYYSSPPLAQGASPSTLYVASPTAGTVVEILEWV